MIGGMDCAGCFSGNALVSMGNGSFKKVSKLARGDRIITALLPGTMSMSKSEPTPTCGSSSSKRRSIVHATGVVDCVVVVKKEQEFNNLHLYRIPATVSGSTKGKVVGKGWTMSSPPMITARHPVFLPKAEQWAHPQDVATSSSVEDSDCDEVYNILLTPQSPSHTIFVNGVVAATLGAGDAEGLPLQMQHPFYADYDLVRRDLVTIDTTGFKTRGRVTVDGVRRGDKSGKTCGFIKARDEPMYTFTVKTGAAAVKKSVAGMSDRFRKAAIIRGAKALAAPGKAVAGALMSSNTHLNRPVAMSIKAY